MNTLHDLTALGLPVELLVEWAQHLVGAPADPANVPLTELQRHCLAHPRFVEPMTNLVVAGPTSSGKSLVAHTLLARALVADPPRRGVYFVPIRALVMEKAAELRALLPRSRVVEVSSDFPQNDALIAGGEWDVAVAVFDKAYAWLADASMMQVLLRSVECVVVDEVQSIGIADRGDRLETVLALLRWHQDAHRWEGRVIAMGASSEVAAALSVWLRAAPLPEVAIGRPVPLYCALRLPVAAAPSRPTAALLGASPGPADSSEGTMPAAVADSMFEVYLAGPAGTRVGVADVPLPYRRVLHRDSPRRSNRWLARAVAIAAQEGLRTIVYIPGVKFRRQLVDVLKHHLVERGVHPSLVAPLADLDESKVVEELHDLLRFRIAVHAGMMSPAERALVEDAFRRDDPDPPVVALLATNTLAMGVNLPADVVILSGMMTKEKHHRPDGGATVRERVFTPLEFLNWAGRAGRLRSRAIGATPAGVCVAISDKRNLEAARAACTAPPSPPSPPLAAPGGGVHAPVLTVCAAIQPQGSGRPHSRSEVGDVFARTWSAQRSPQLVAERVVQALEELVEHGVLDEDGVRPAGRVLARFALSSATMWTLLERARDIDSWAPDCPQDVLWPFLDHPELRASFSGEPGVGASGTEAWHVWRRESRALAGARLAADGRGRGGRVARFLAGAGEVTPSDARAVRRLVLMEALWRPGHPPRRAERWGVEFEDVSASTCQIIGEACSTIVSALRLLLAGSFFRVPDEERVARSTQSLWELEQSLRLGVPIAALPIAVPVNYVIGRAVARPAMIALLAHVGERDPRGLLGAPAPADGPARRHWGSFQAGLRFWVEKMAGGPPESPLAAVSSWLDAIIARRTVGQAGRRRRFERVLPEIEVGVVSIALSEPETWLGHVHSALSRAPLAVGVTSTHGLGDLPGTVSWTLRFGTATRPAIVLMRPATEQTGRNLRPRLARHPTLIVGPTRDDVAALTGLPPGTSVVTVHAVLVMAALVARHPEFASGVLATLQRPDIRLVDGNDVIDLLCETGSEESA